MEKESQALAQTLLTEARQILNDLPPEAKVLTVRRTEHHFSTATEIEFRLPSGGDIKVLRWIPNGAGV